jgi:predicted  nucleic acid-binding Zn-ribbon protein
VAEEISALLRLAELDAALLRGEAGRRGPQHGEVANERLALRARISHETLDAYERTLRAGRQPAVVALVASVCTGCHVRLHSKLDHQIRERRGIAPCPRCLRLVYEPTWIGSGPA